MLKNNLAKLLLVLIIVVHSLLLTKLIFFPYPELFIYPYLTNNGLKPYSQILDQHFPGLMFLPINFDNLGMNTPQTARIWLIGSVLITQILLFFVARKILKSEKRALIVNLLYLFWQPFFEGWVLWIDSFLPVILLPSFYFLYSRRFFLAGFFLGIAIVFKQVLIPLALLLFVYLIWQKRNLKIAGFFILGLLGPIGLMLIFLSWLGVLSDFWYWAVIFNLTTFAEFGRGTVPTLAHFSRALLAFGTAFVAILRMKEKEAQLLFIFLAGTLFGLSTRFDFVHFQPALPFAVLATIFGLGGLGRLRRIGMVSGYGMILIWWLIIFYKGHLGDRVISFDAEIYDISAKIKNYTSPKDKIFVFGAAPHLYQMTKTLPAGDVFVFQFPWFFQIAQSRILEGIKKDKPNIVVADRTVRIDKQPITEFGSIINQYLTENYEKIDNIGNTEILRKK